MDLLEKKVLPTYYNHPDEWTAIMKRSMQDIIPYFDSDRLAQEYYHLLYTQTGADKPPSLKKGLTYS